MFELKIKKRKQENNLHALSPLPHPLYQAFFCHFYFVHYCKELIRKKKYVLNLEKEEEKYDEKISNCFQLFY